MLEATLRKKFRNWCREKNYLQIPLTGVTMSGCPDCYLVDKQCFIEFKRSKGWRVSPIQKYVHKQIREHSGIVYVINNPDDFEILESEVI